MDVDYTHLPPSVRLEETIEQVDVRPVQDPDAGQNVAQRIALHHVGG